MLVVLLMCDVMMISASEEADPLQQALVLVELLKAEYARVNKENLSLRERMNVDQQTCPTTTEQTNGIYSEDRLLQHPFRRLLNAPDEGRLKSQLEQSRRLDYEDAFGPHPGGDLPSKATPISTQTETTQATVTTETTSTKTTFTTTSSSTSSSLNTSKTLPADLSSVSVVHKENSTVKSTTISKNEITTRKTRLKKLGMKNKTVDSTTEGKVKLNHKRTTRNPVLEQVASEIMSEIKDSEASTPAKYRFYSAPLFSGKTKKYTRFDNIVKGTLRIHQATSKKYQLPLPENNAFCFFHPDSGMCRTII